MRTVLIALLFAAALPYAIAFSRGGLASAQDRCVDPSATCRSRTEADGSLLLNPGQILPADTDILPVPPSYADGYAVYDRYGYAVVGHQKIIVDRDSRQIINFVP